MRVLPILAVVTLMLTASAQFQPTDPDWSPFESREDIVAAGDLEGAQRVLRFVQVSDAHILDDDAPQPMRVDALDDFFFGTGVSDGAERPQEEFTDEVLDAQIRAINALHAQDPFDFVLNTGDNIDNQLENELMRFIDNWEGRFTTEGPVSGLTCLPDGQSASADDEDNDVEDSCTHLPESMATDNTPLAPGLPWFSAFGNHDGLIQGNVPVEPSFQEIAAEYGRQFLQQSDYVGMHFDAGGSCVGGDPAGQLSDDFGHGYGFAGARLCDEDPDNDGYYAFGSRGVRFIVLDTVNDDFVTSNSNFPGGFNPETTLGNDVIGGYAEGSIDAAQYSWLLSELNRTGDELVVLFSHHTVNSMFTKQAEGQCGGPNGECLHDLLREAGYRTGEDLIEALSQYPNVVGWVGGHTHRHRIQSKVVEGADSPGFWNVETSSLIDLPQESRVVEMWVTADGAKGFFALSRFSHDFQESKDLAATDEQFDAEAANGGPEDRDVLLWFDIPPGVTLVPQASLPQVLRLEQTAPQRINGTHGMVGEEVDVVLQISDQVAGRGVQGLAVKVDIEHAGGTGVVQVLNTTLDDQGDGNYTFSFTPEEPRVHFLAYQVTDPLGAYPDADRVMSLDIGGDEEEPKKSKKSPGVALPLVLLGILALLRRR